MATAVAHIGCSSRGGPGSTTIVGPSRPSGGGTTSPGAVPTGSSTVAPSGTIACLRFPARTASMSMSGKRGERAQDLGDPLLDRGVEFHLPLLEVAHDFGREVVAVGQPAAGDHQVQPVGGHEGERLTHVLGTVSDDRREGQLDAELLQPFGQPGAVADATRPVSTSVPVTTIPARAPGPPLH